MIEKNNIQNKKISIITIVLNDEEKIEKTLQSVINQTYSNIEYIVIDGLSKDNTLNIINKYRGKIDKIVSERDNGIYDAMNKGITLSTGDYIWFINSGDEVYQKDTVYNIFNKFNEDYPDVIYGRTALFNSRGELVKIPRTPRKIDSFSFTKGMPVSHQGFIAKKELVEYYNLSYRYVSDQDWIIKILKKNRVILNTDMIISKYILGGFSNSNFLKVSKEKFKIVKTHFGYYYYLKNIIYFCIEFVKYYLKKILKRDFLVRSKEEY